MPEAKPNARNRQNPPGSAALADMAAGNLELTTRRELARICKTTERNVIAWDHAGTGPPKVKLGRLVRYYGIANWLKDKAA